MRGDAVSVGVLACRGVVGGPGLREAFRCGGVAGGGWHFQSELSTSDGRTAGSVDVTIDGIGRVLRLDLTAGEWSLRGGSAGSELLWVRRPTGAPERPSVEQREKAHGFRWPGAGSLVAAAALTATDGTPTRLRFLALSDVLGVTRRDEQWTLVGQRTHRAGGSELKVTTYEVVVLDTGHRSLLRMAGDVVLAADGCELLELDSPPGPALPQPP